MGDRRNESQARVGYIFGKLESISSGEVASIKVQDVDYQVFIDDSKLIDLVEINKDGNASYDRNCTSVSELRPFDEQTKTGDVVYISTANKGQLNNVIVYRFL